MSSDDGVSFYSIDDIEKAVDRVLMQTNYSKEEATNKLKQFNCNSESVIRDYLGIALPKDTKSKSFNQEIYRQFRQDLDTSMREYRAKKPIDMDQLVDNISRSEEMELEKTTNRA